MILTDVQNKAANFVDGPCLVLAVPGAGKTTMLLERINNLSKNIPQNKILTLTFSRTQAIDMKNRFGSDDTNIMTIHAFCYLIIRNYLKKYHKELRLLESTDAYNKYDLVRRIYQDINNKKVSREDVLTFFTETSYMKNAMLDEAYLQQVRIKNIEKVYEVYENFKKSNNYIDFDDMQTIALRLLDENPRLLKSIQKKYQYFQLDEGQDTSLLQFEILNRIVGLNNNFMVVADDDQSIYSFRAANPDYLLNFKDYYPGAEIIIMNENHRSSKNIAKLAGDFIKDNNFRYEKDLISKKSDGEKIIIKTLKDAYDQYNFIKKNIDLSKSNAILFRNNISAINLVTFLLDDGMDFAINNDFLDFFKSQIIDDFFDIIKFSDDFSNVEAFENVYYKIKTYLKKTEVEKLRTKPINLDIFDFFYEILDYDRKNSLYDIEKKLRHMRKLPLSRKISYIYKYLGYKEYSSLKANKFAEEVINKDLFVESLINFTKDLETIEDFDRKILNLKKKIKLMPPSNLILQSIHRSKGLEYDKTFIIDMNKNEFPIIDYDKDPEASLEEERRVFYVGMTRARENLYILALKKRNGKKTLPSEFYSSAKNLIK
ncbi:ATP-dependent helicase [Anaerococcus degeneri]|uniref:DNA 3'-5' helicase n=1 Tax=Anaerococcus degeneri TaxID=361500 RepID=A0ABS7YWI2_9FIRM|nr:ATP-dependent helicase [Anaerococcus degeneri]MBP2015139.1 DNA helicase-2/ATP-dependent DNA helicase PcrA [Anaerococcus degeneri]MCA2095399.1 ATP-dependent helicase [Anaerococcus degeneri]